MRKVGLGVWLSDTAVAEKRTHGAVTHEQALAELLPKIQQETNLPLICKSHPGQKRERFEDKPHLISRSSLRGSWHLPQPSALSVLRALGCHSFRRPVPPPLSMSIAQIAPEAIEALYNTIE